MKLELYEISEIAEASGLDLERLENDIGEILNRSGYLKKVTLGELLETLVELNESQNGNS